MQISNFGVNTLPQFIEDKFHILNRIVIITHGEK